jgi:geranylgeranyl pyrophosphate synthase
MSDLALARDSVKGSIEALIARERDAMQREMLRYLFAGALDRPAWGSLGRGSLLMLLAGESPDSLPLSASVELLHHASLIVDDLVDRAIERRSLPAFWVKFGEETAILFAHKLVPLALTVGGRPIVRRGMRDAVQTALLTTITDMANAELESQRADSPTLEAYLDNVRRRTGGLFRLVGTLAGLLDCSIVAKPAAACEALGNIGAARQMADDFVDARLTHSCIRIFATDAAACANNQHSIYGLLQKGYSIESLLSAHQRLSTGALQQLQDALVDSEAKACALEICQHACFREMEAVAPNF